MFNGLCTIKHKKHYSDNDPVKYILHKTNTLLNYQMKNVIFMSVSSKPPAVNGCLVYRRNMGISVELFYE